MMTQFIGGSAVDYTYVFFETGECFALHPGSGCRQVSSSHLHVRPLLHCQRIGLVKGGGCSYAAA